MSATATLRRPDSRNTARVALFAVLATEGVFFGTLLSAYLFLRLNEPDWPLTHAPASALLLPAINTGVLLVSAILAAWGLTRIRRGDGASLQLALLLSLVLGLLFVAGQAFEFTRSGMRPSDQAFGGVFFTLMGFHALHVLGGVVVLAINLVRGRLGDFSAARHIAVEMGTWFWLFVTGVWVVLFTALYLV
jgi:cytochrome c oxidase subunit 3